jgi:hypothetical protein
MAMPEATITEWIPETKKAGCDRLWIGRIAGVAYSSGLATISE